jgi:hypothetical protein
MVEISNKNVNKPDKSLMNQSLNSNGIELLKQELKPKIPTEFKYKSLIKETLYNSTAQALIKILETPYYTLKAFLLMCVILSSGLCAYLILELILSYFSYGVSTSSRTLYETPSIFPKITICSLNPFTSKYAMDFIRKINKDVNADIDIFDQETMNRLDFISRYKLITETYYHAILKMNDLKETEKRKLTHSLKETMPISQCSFNARECSVDDFVWHFDPLFGNCWIFNSGFNETTGDQVPLVSNSIPGESYGLQIKFYVNFYQNLTSYTNLGGQGALIRIDNHSYSSSYIGSDGIKIVPGHLTSVSMSRSFKSILPKPYSNCLITNNEIKTAFQSGLFDLFLNSTYRYTQSTCFMQCYQRIFLLECNCTNSAIISLFPNRTKCSTKNETECIGNVFFKKILNDNKFLGENCLSECPLECYLDQFDVTLSSNELTANLYLDYLKSNETHLSEDFPTTQIDLETARKSFVNLKIFYKSLSYEVTTETPQLNAFTLFSNIGGYLGLFLGVSAFSLFEAIQVLIEILNMYRNF